jgi:hypothetical protein
MTFDALQMRFEAARCVVLAPVAVLSLCVGLNAADARPAALTALGAEPMPLRAVDLAAATKKDRSKARTQPKDRPKKSEEKPRCIDVGGYEAYMRRTGKICEIGAEGYQAPGYRMGR